MKTSTFATAGLIVLAAMGCSSNSDKSVGEQVATATPLTASGGHVTGKVTRHSSLDIEATFDGCTNHPGPTVTFSGIMSTDGQDALIIGKNNRKGTHTTDPAIEATATVVLGDPSGPIVLPKQPPLGGVGGNPFIYFQPYDEQGRALGDAVLLGRCVQGLAKAHFDLSWLADLDMHVDTDFCDNSPGPVIKISGTLSAGPGVNGKIWFQNQKVANPAHISQEFEANASIVIAPKIDPSYFAKQPPLGGAGGNPLLYLQLLDSNDQKTGPELFLGRCNKL